MRLVASIAPVVHNFDRIAPHPEALNLFFALTIWSVVPKTMFWYWWLHSNEKLNAKYFIITPLTTTKPASHKEFVEAPAVDYSASELPRSKSSRVFWSCATLLIWLGLGWVTFTFGFQVQDIGRGDVKVFSVYKGADVANGGVGLWIPWSLLWATFYSLFTAIAFTVLRDTVRIVKDQDLHTLTRWGR